jgi:hypothetical protein
MITLHYASKNIKRIYENIDDDIIELILKDQNELDLFIQDIVKGDDNKTVYLFASNFNKDPLKEDLELESYREIIIEACPYRLAMLLKGCYDYEDCEVFFQEYESFEDAYKVALSMRELNPLCYNSD